MLTDYKLQTNKPLICPRCDANLDAAFGDRMPNDNDVSVCGYCAVILIFKGKGMDITLHRISAKELSELKFEYPDFWQQIMDARRWVIEHWHEKS